MRQTGGAFGLKMIHSYMLVVCSGGEVLCLKFKLGIVVDANATYGLGREATTSIKFPSG